MDFKVENSVICLGYRMLIYTPGMSANRFSLKTVAIISINHGIWDNILKILGVQALIFRYFDLQVHVLQYATTIIVWDCYNHI